ncbi:MAG: carboxypeptidase regulatory-like domain-containing protein [Acidobacteria bacterium]|nr:carboxypeptidase regulatory-like domain-containing protein [Acidobacteriota bacterium]
MTRQKWIGLVLLVGIAVVPLLGSSAGKVSGIIQDTRGTPLSKARVAVVDPKALDKSVAATQTTPEGIFTIANLQPGKYALKVSLAGFKPLTESTVEISPGQTTIVTLFLDALSALDNQEDPRNWPLKAVLRGEPTDRMIFRHQAEEVAEVETPKSPFLGSGTVEVTSTGNLSGDDYTVFPFPFGNGLLTSFAYLEPLGHRARYILAGQLHSGDNSLWKIKNYFTYQLDPGHEVRMILGYGRIGFTEPRAASWSNPEGLRADVLLLEDVAAVRNLHLVLEESRQAGPLRVVYGFDTTLVRAGVSHLLWNPVLQVFLTPTDNLGIRGRISSRRESAQSSLALPEEQSVNLADAVYISKVDGRIRTGSTRHYDLSLVRKLDPDTDLEVTGFLNQVTGKNVPFLAILNEGGQLRSRLLELDDRAASMSGLRFVINRRLLSCLNGTVAYAVGSGATLPSRLNSPVTNEDALLAFVERELYQAVTTQVDTAIEKFNTEISTIYQWAPGNHIAALDAFYDRKDVFNGGLNVLIRQPIPFRDFLGIHGELIALFDARNLLDETIGHVQTESGDVVLVRNPRSIRGGLAFRF